LSNVTSGKCAVLRVQHQAQPGLIQAQGTVTSGKCAVLRVQRGTPRAARPAPGPCHIG